MADALTVGVYPGAFYPGEAYPGESGGPSAEYLKRVASADYLRLNEGRPHPKAGHLESGQISEADLMALHHTAQESVEQPFVDRRTRPRIRY